MPHFEESEFLELKRSTSELKQNIAKLKLRCMVRRIGPARGGYWQVLGNWE
ncbi:MAG: hypothetical protein ACE5IY_16675 [bacterium]